MIPTMETIDPVEARILLRDHSKAAPQLRNAVLVRLSSGTAVVQVSGECSPRWGDTVRLQLEDGEFVTELEGGVALVCMDSAGHCTLLVRCWQHLVSAQRRKLPRRHMNVAVKLMTGSKADKDISVATCTEIGAGGMRLVTGATCAVGDIVNVALPVSEDHHGCESADGEVIVARVTRRCRAAGSDLWELAIRFEMISTRQGKLLADLFAA